MKVTITGPRSVGKTSISKIVARKLKLKYISSDHLGNDAFRVYGGLDKAMKSGKVLESIKSGGYSLIINTYKKDNFVFDLSGGSFTSNKTPKLTLEVRKVARKRSIVIGLLPSKNPDESINLLFERERKREHFKDMDPKDLFEKTKVSYSNFPDTFNEFCNLVVYTENKTPEAIAKEIVHFIMSKK